jgi:hypothetical protein
MLINPGDKVHIIARRNFDGDLRRHFAGEVVNVTDVAISAVGYTFVFNARKNQYIRRPEQRNRIFSLIDSNNIINIIPKDANIEKVMYKMSPERQLVVTDDKTFSLNIDEFANLT